MIGIQYVRYQQQLFLWKVVLRPNSWYYQVDQHQHHHHPNHRFRTDPDIWSRSVLLPWNMTMRCCSDDEYRRFRLYLPLHFPCARDRSRSRSIGLLQNMVELLHRCMNVTHRLPSSYLMEIALTHTIFGIYFEVHLRRIVTLMIMMMILSLVDSDSISNSAVSCVDVVSVVVAIIPALPHDVPIVYNAVHRVQYQHRYLNDVRSVERSNQRIYSIVVLLAHYW